MQSSSQANITWPIQGTPAGSVGMATVFGGYPIPSYVPAVYFSPAVPATAAAVAAYELEQEQHEDTDIPTCHLHTKPQLHCKFCRKFKTSVHQQARLAQQREAEQPQEERRNMVEITNPTTYNLNYLLRENILASEYFKSLYRFKTYHEVVDEIYHYVKNAEPYCPGNSRAPSTLFCCLYKFFTMRLTERQVRGLLDHVDSPYIRCTGFLYLRYVHPPERLWRWYEPYFLDDEEFVPGFDGTRKTTIGEYVEGLVTGERYFSTVLPRLPVRIQNQYGSQLMALEQHRKRKRRNKENIEKFVTGTPVSACSNGDWLDGEVVEIVEPHLGRLSCLVKLEDSSEEVIDLGLVMLQEDDEEGCNEESRSRHHKHRKKKSSKKHRRSQSREAGQSRHVKSKKDKSRSPSVDGKVKDVANSVGSASVPKCSASPAGAPEDAGGGRRQPQTHEELMGEYRRRQREKAVASGKDYARRPTSYKSSLSLRLEVGTTRKRSKSPSPGRAQRENRQRSPSADECKKKEPSLEHKLKIAQLMERYTKGASDAIKSRGDVEGPDVMRLG